MVRRKRGVAPVIDPAIEPVRFMKIPPFVYVYEITNGNMSEVAKWADATMTRDTEDRPLIILRKMPPPYNKGYVGDLVVKSESGDRRIAKKDEFFSIYVVAPED